ncbi:MAG: cytochrome c [Pseudomonadota bacterium]|nr:cytochrome c [Pseudomonadota bacterium]
MKVILVSLVVLLPALSLGDGKQRAVQCAACHGDGGVSTTPMWPNLAGQKKDYLVKQLKDFKTGNRKDPVMSPQAAALSDADIEDLAKYFSGLKCGK